MFQTRSTEILYTRLFIFFFICTDLFICLFNTLTLIFYNFLPSNTPDDDVHTLKFWKDSNEAVATKNSYNVYPCTLNISKYKNWFSTLRAGDSDLSDLYQADQQH